MSEIVLATLNAKYIHASFGLRYLMANLGPLESRACIREFDINQKPLEIVEALLASNPRIVGLGVYIWNVVPTTEVVHLLKKISPEVMVILGGPEVSFEIDQQEIVRMADYVITGEADLEFRKLCELLVAGEKPLSKIVVSDVPLMENLQLPYRLYDADDIAHRVLYVEASRGCPFTCEFCLSSLEVPVRQVALERLLPELVTLLDRGVTQFKFVDRTFNLNLNTSRKILEFFLEKMRPGLFVHFEMIPDRLPEGLREVIAKFPPGALQFEVGIQTFNDLVSKNISRRQDYRKLEDNFAFLRQNTGVHIHADLIVGLPGESVESFGLGFDRLVAMRPQEIQVGILKRLRGTPIVRHDREWQMVYSAHPPYEILKTSSMTFRELQKMRRFARYWDLVGNSGNFAETVDLLWQTGDSPFASFIELSEWIYQRTGKRHAIALVILAELLFIFLQEKNISARQAAQVVWNDYKRGGHFDKPAFLKDYVSDEEVKQLRAGHFAPKRQARHLATSLISKV
jgi:radical SAM superfamily enzyme YgiQ (UPF0313 family)